MKSLLNDYRMLAVKGALSMKNKKILLIILLMTIALLVACGGNEEEQEATAAPDEPASEPATSDAEAPPEAETPAEVEAPTEAPAPTDTSIPPSPTPIPPTPTPLPPLTLTSSAFEDGGTIPNQYSCFGDNISPALAWTGVPEEAESLALLMDDPDSQPPGFVHWVTYNIPTESDGFPEDIPAGPTLDDGTLQGTNDFAPFGAGNMPGGAPVKIVGYDGPCPGDEHRYVFTLYALDTTLDLPAEVILPEVVAAMEGHILDQAEIVGLYDPPE
jgi:Raf kinase inhibitor-like YbhB/YbcL family protein